MKERYNEYLKSGEWKQKRLDKIKQVNHTCEGCGEKSGSMEIHHQTYERVGMELLSDLLALCINCHKTIHGCSATDWHKYLTNKSDIKPKEMSIEGIKMQRIIDAI